MKKHRIIIFLFLIGLLISGIHPHDYFTWFLEVFPGILGATILILSYKRFRFTYFTYIFILLHCYILFIGGHYTYAEVPFFDWIKETFHQSRNNYDKVGHFAQGFIPAIIIRELLVRLQIVKKGAWLSFLTVSVCVAISAAYEWFEWFIAIVTGQSSEAFLGTQGDIWDTQSDMLFAFVGAICMVVFFSALHNNMIEKENDVVVKTNN